MRIVLAGLALCLAVVRLSASEQVTTHDVAPGVTFVELPSQPVFSGANSGFIEMDRFVLVVDSGFPLGARLLLETLEQRTTKPPRLVLDTHHHGDHALGHGVFAAQGALILAHEAAAALDRERNRPELAEMLTGGATSRQLADGAEWAGVVLPFSDRLVVDDGARRVEILHLGAGHTPGDAVAWLPRERVLFTGDLCVNGAHNYFGDADTGSWIEVLDRLIDLRPGAVLPGHGAPGDAGLLALQRRWLVELREAVGRGLDEGRDREAIRAALDLPWYREWTGVAARERQENVAHVFDELTGRIPPRELLALGLAEGDSPSRADADWRAPRRVVVVRAPPEVAARLRFVAEGVELVFVDSADAAAEASAGADAVIGACSAAILERGEALRWAAVGSAGVERYVDLPRIADRSVVLTNAQAVHGPPIADHVMALTLALARGLPAALRAHGEGAWRRQDVDDAMALPELTGRTLLVVGLGGIGREVAARAHGLGMRVLALKSRAGDPPPGVARLGGSEDLLDFAAESDVIVNCLPLTEATTGIFGAEFFARAKHGALFVNIGRGRSVDTGALVAALEAGRLGGAGLDVTDPEPLPSDHPLWSLPNVIVTPHVAARADARGERVWMLFRENLRRFAAGERLLAVVDPERGY